MISLGTAFLLFQYVLLVSRPLEELVHELETVQKANGAVVRALGCLAAIATLGLFFVPAFFETERRAVHDRMAGTRVVIA